MLTEIYDKFLKYIFGNSLVVYIWQAAALAFIIRIIGAGLAFILNIVIGRYLGVAGAGEYFLALSVVMTCSIIAKLGLDNSLLRFVSSGAGENNWVKVKGVFNLGFYKAVLVSSGLSLLVFIFSDIIAVKIFSNNNMNSMLRVISLSIIFYTAMTLLSECLKGISQIKDSMLVSSVYYPIVSLVVIIPLIEIYGKLGAAIAYTIGVAFSSFIGLWSWRNKIPNYSAVVGKFDKQVLSKSSRPLWLMNIINGAFIPFFPIILLGIWSSVESSGIFGAATRIALLVSFFLSAINTVIAPKFSELYTKKNFGQLVYLTRYFTLFILIVTSPIFIVLIFYGDWVMSMFGDDFAKGGIVLSVLACGQLVQTAAGPVAYLLMMSGHEKDMLIATLLSALSLLVFSLIFIMEFDLLGVAFASTLSFITSSAYSTYRVRKTLGFNIWSFESHKNS